MQPKSRDRRASEGDRGVRDAEIFRLAAQQHAVVSGRQLLELGLGYGAIKHRVDTGRLRRLRRGIYLVGPTVLPLSLEMAAILACGPNAVLSHESAAALHQLLSYTAKGAPIVVTVGPADPGPRPGIRIHRSSRLQPDGTTSRQRIPVTTPARTLLDLAATLTAGRMEQAVAEAHRKRLAAPQALHALIARYPGAPGSRRSGPSSAATDRPPSPARTPNVACST